MVESEDKSIANDFSEELNIPSEINLQDSCSDDSKDETSISISTTDWNTVGECVVGMAHRRITPPVGCQDSCSINNSRRLCMVACDGAGSSKASDVSARVLTQSIVRLVYSIEKIIVGILDSEANPETCNMLASIVFDYATKLVLDLSVETRRDEKDYRTTMLVIISGLKKLFWLKIGDGEIIIEENGLLSRLGTSIKGDYFNQTIFVENNLEFSDVQYGVIPSDKLSGIAIMTDGASERLVSYDGKMIASKLNNFFSKLRNNKLPREQVYKFLIDHSIWEGTTHDDKTLVLAAR